MDAKTGTQKKIIGIRNHSVGLSHRIHANISIDCSPALNHQPEFAAHCITETADIAVIDEATAMTWIAIELAPDVDTHKRLTESVSA